MKVLDIMSTKVVSIYKDESVLTAVRKMEDAKNHHLVVVDIDGSLLGIISDRDCKKALSSPFATYAQKTAEGFADKIPVERIMSVNLVTVMPRLSVQEAAKLMIEQHINALPVMHDHSVIGIVTSTDLLKVLAELPEIVKV